MERIPFPDAEAVARLLLVDHLPGVHVSTRLPNPLPDKVVRVSRIGGPRINALMDAPEMLFECWASTSPEAAALAGDVHEVLYAARNGTAVGTVRVKATSPTGPVNLPDPDTALTRYQFTCSLTLRLAG